MDFLNLDDAVIDAIKMARGVAREYGCATFGAPHLLYALLNKECGVVSFLEAIGKDAVYIREWAEVRLDDYPKEKGAGEIIKDDRMSGIMEEADNIRIKWGMIRVIPLCVLAALAKPEVGFTADELKSFPVREREIHDTVLLGNPSDFGSDESGQPSMFAFSETKKSSLEKYCTDMLAEARDQKIFLVISREREERMMLEILGRKGKPHVLITGDSGVGKTALVNGLACRIVNGEVPAFLKESAFYELDMGALIAGATYKGEIEERLKGIIRELEPLGGAILFIDEIHMLLDPKQGNSGAAGILKPELTKGLITVIGATTVDEYRKLIEPDHAFSRMFEVLNLEEPHLEAAVKMVGAVLERYVEWHGVGVNNESLSDCVALAKRYVKERRLPDSAIDLIDRTLSAVKIINEGSESQWKDTAEELARLEAAIGMPEKERTEHLVGLIAAFENRLSPIVLSLLSEGSHEWNTFDEGRDFLLARIERLQELANHPLTEVGAHEVAAVIASATGIPVGKIETGEKEKLMALEDLLRRRVVGQDHALKVLADAIVESRSGMNKAGQPIGSFFLLGPTGTGKTELAKALAEALFNDEKAMIRFDMSEFKEEHSAALLYGAPPGYVGYEEGGLLVNKIRQQPYAVVLFDEIEKAHTSVYDIFLQIMDEGKLHDRLGKEGDFSNAIVLFTSNVGSDWLMKQMDAGNKPSTTQLMEVMGSYFRPEFLARLSEIVPFSPVNEEMLTRIFDIQLRSVTSLLEKQGIRLDVSDEARRLLAFRGFTPKYGARQVAGTIRNQIRRPISRMLIAGEVQTGNVLVLSTDEAEEVKWDIK